MKKRGFVLGIISIVLVIGFSLAGCVTFTSPTSDNVAEGKHFNKVHTDFFEASSPIEEHCYIINLARWTEITQINGKKSNIGYKDITILPHGDHSFNVYFGSRYGTTNIRLSTFLVPGNYYVILSEINGNNLKIWIELLEAYSEVAVYQYGDDGQMIPVKSIMEGMNVKIAQKFRGFQGGIRWGADDEKDVPIVIVFNNLTIPIKYLYISIAGKNQWVDILNGKTISPGNGGGDYLPAYGSYDIKVEDSDGNTYTFLNGDFTGVGGSAGKAYTISPDKRDN